MLPPAQKSPYRDMVCVDHDHTCCSEEGSCGKCVRGLIHRHCNTLLGLALEDPSILRAAVTYLERYPRATPIKTVVTS
jgi:hypothetical protein